MTESANTVSRIRSTFTANAGLFTHVVSYRASQFVVLAANRLKISPNALTTYGFFLSLFSASLLLVPGRSYAIAAALLLQAGFVFDCADGQLARLTNATSSFGAWYDFFTDRLREYALYVALAFGLYAQTHDYRYFIAGFVATAVDALRHQDVLVRTKGQSVIEQSPLASRFILRPGGQWRTRLKYTVLLDIGTRLAVISALLLINRTTLVFPVLIAWGGLLIVVKAFLTILQFIHHPDPHADH